MQFQSMFVCFDDLLYLLLYWTRLLAGEIASKKHRYRVEMPVTPCNASSAMLSCSKFQK